MDFLSTVNRVAKCQTQAPVSYWPRDPRRIGTDPFPVESTVSTL